MDLALVLLLLLPFCWHLAGVGHAAMDRAFTLHAPGVSQSPVFQHDVRPPANYDPPEAWAGASLLSMKANRGFLDCYSVPNRAQPQGAIASDAPSYKGEAYLVEGPGTARVEGWSPSRAEVQVRDAAPDAMLVYNMNFDPNWRANGQPVLEFNHAVATRVQAGTERVVFDYFPRRLPWGLALALVTLLAMFLVPRAWLAYHRAPHAT